LPDALFIHSLHLDNQPSILLYAIIKIFIRLALRIFCRETRVFNPGMLREPGPMLVVANHPNSFLDAIIIGSVFSHPVHFLARGDVFNKPWHGLLLRSLNMVPVYRISEGKENLSKNEYAFDQCKRILSANGIVLIFIEGICVNRHELQPFKKGAARIAIGNSSLKNFRILPLGIAYDSLTEFGKRIQIDIAEPVAAKNILPFDEEVRNRQYFNQYAYEKISGLIRIPDAGTGKGRTTQYLLLLPGIIGYILHAPLYGLLKNLIREATKGTVFYDSVLFGALLLVYPLYLLILALLLSFSSLSLFVIIGILLLHPLTAWCATRLGGGKNPGDKSCLDL
jgi:1-acyl-sn-glycerol-3-phosphate acyltransferase